MNKILFSPIGTSDPISNYHDGAMLHIVRIKKPNKIVLFFTNAMSEIEKKDKRFTEAIKKVNPNCDIKEIHTEITMAHQFDEYIGIFQKHLKEIYDENKDSEILVNISSGTPQIKTALCIDSLNCDFFVDILQVENPVFEINKNRKDYNAEEFNLENAFKTNDDNETDEVKSRILRPKLKILKKNNVSHQIEALIERYQYTAALYVYNNNKELFYEKEQPVEKLKFLLEHASDRVDLKLIQQSKSVTSFDDKLIYPINSKTNKELYYLTEYFNLIKIKVLNKELPEFLLKMTPYIYELTLYYLKEIVNYPLVKISYENNNDFKISIKKIKTYDERLFDFLNNKFNKKFYDNSSLSLLIIIYIIEYLLNMKEDTESKSRFKKIKFDLINIEIYKYLLFFREFESKLRNGAAHTIISINEEDIKEVSKNSKVDGMAKQKDSIFLLEDLEKLTYLILKNMLDKAKINNIIFIYDELNKLIKEELKN